MEDPRQTVRERLRDVRARHILSVAQALLLEKGYRDASMDELAARAGLAKGTVYQHFPHKEDLVRALLEQHIVAFELTVEEAAAAGGRAPEKLASIVRYVYRDRDGAFAMLQLLTRDAEVRACLAPGKGPAMRRLERAQAGIMAILESGRAEGSLDPAIPTGLMLSAFFSALSLGRPDRRLGLDGLTPEELGEHVTRVLFRGIVRGNAHGEE